MKRYPMAVTAAIIIAMAGFSGGCSSSAGPATANVSEPVAANNGSSCTRTEFRTDLIREACAEGGQDAARKAMKKFLAKAKKAGIGVTNCKSCHATLKPDYQLKPEGLELFEKANASAGSE